MSAVFWQSYERRWHMKRWRFCRLAYVVMMRRRLQRGMRHGRGPFAELPKHISISARAICVALRLLLNATLRVSVALSGLGVLPCTR
jgi:hypothetical protein